MADTKDKTPVKPVDKDEDEAQEAEASAEATTEQPKPGQPSQHSV
jgi:hypothetical protein